MKSAKGKGGDEMKMPKQMPCDLCLKTFATWSGLRHHKQTQNGVKKYVVCTATSHLVGIIT